MKKLLLLFTTAFIVTMLSAQQPGAAIDIQHYNFAIALNDSSDQIKGRATIELLYIKSSPVITLDLTSVNADHKGMQVVMAIENGKPLQFTHSNNLLTIQLAANRGDHKKIEVVYEGIPADGLIISKNKYGHRGFFADNWPNRAHNWFPCVDHPADKASFEFTVTAPAHYQVISNGVKTKDTLLANDTRFTHYTETTPLSTKIMVIGVADFAIQQSGEVAGIPITSWVYPEEKEPGFYDYALAVDILPFFIKHVGGYAFKKLANVESTTRFGGMENASAIFYSDEVSITGTRKSESLLAHEIAHQWFGDMATEADWSHLWLSEGFATYMTILYFEHKYGADTAKYMLQKNRTAVIDFAHRKPRPVVDSTVTNYMELLNANSYQKGGWVLHMLRREVGDTIFWKGIQQYYSRFAGKNATSDDLRKIMEEVAGKDLKQFFQQWLYVAGVPKLEVQWKYNRAKKAVTITVVQQQTPLYQFPLQVAINQSVKTIAVSNKQTTITVPVNAAPTVVALDPGVNLLFEGTVTPVK